MKQVALVLCALTLTAAAAYLGMQRVEAKTTKAEEATEARAAAHAAEAFLAGLSPDQRLRASFAFQPEKTATLASFTHSPRPPGAPPAGKPPEAGGPPPGGPGQGPPGGFTGERYGQAVWSNFPTSDVPRPGLPFGELNPAQRDAAMHLLQVVLSPMGYRKVADIMGSDQALADGGTNYCAGIACYTIGIFGKPSDAKPWMLEFGGHHLGLNIVIAGSQGVMTPTLTGAQPSVYTAAGKTIRVLAQENDKAFALLDALDPAQRKQAILDYHLGDLVFGPGHPVQKILPEGIKGSALTDKQRAMMLDVMSEWAGIIHSAYATPRIAQLKSGLNDTYFAWSGPLTHQPGQNGSAYYRIQGPRVLIEFSPQDTSGDPILHVHTMYRDPLNDYGIQFTTVP